MRYSIIAGVLALLICSMVNAQQATVNADSMHVSDSLDFLQLRVEAAQDQVDALSPHNGSFKSMADRATYFKALAVLKKVNVDLFSYLSKSDPDNRTAYLLRCRSSKVQYNTAMNEYYKSLEVDSPKIKYDPVPRLDLN